MHPIGETDEQCSSRIESRRNFMRKAAYVSPAILTLHAAPAFAKAGSFKSAPDPNAGDVRDGDAGEWSSAEHSDDIGSAPADRPDGRGTRSASTVGTENGGAGDQANDNAGHKGTARGAGNGTGGPEDSATASDRSTGMQGARGNAAGNGSGNASGVGNRGGSGREDDKAERSDTLKNGSGAGDDDARATCLTAHKQTHAPPGRCPTGAS
jgi:hypothetical protein